MFESPLFWPAYIKGNTLYVLDETLVPSKLKYIPVKNVKGAVAVIRDMKTRAFGQFLVVLNTFLLELTPDATSGVIPSLRSGQALSQQAKDRNLIKHLQDVAQQLNNSRPTFPFAEVTGIITGVAQKASANGADIRIAVTKTVHGFLAGIRARRLQRVQEIADAMNDKDSVLTHCNVSGELAMAASLAARQGKHIKFFATETRPYLQGAKLTVWELSQAKARVTLIADNAVGSLMADGLINKVIIGSDRSAANGDIANKIGSYQIAILAREFGIPLIVLTQPSQGVASGEDMPIEIRDEDEFLVFNGKRIFGPKVKGFYPGFDVVPHQLITKAIAIHAGL